MIRNIRRITPLIVFVLLVGLLLVAAPVLTRAQGVGDVVINEFLADPALDLPGDANGDGVRDAYDDEFVEIVNLTDHQIDISSWTFIVDGNIKHTFPEDTVLRSGCGIVVFGGGTPTGNFGNCLVQLSSEGKLGLVNSGAAIELRDGSSQLIDAYTYDGSMADDDQSLTRSPDLTGTFARHSDIPAAEGRLFSPGTMLDGSLFPGCHYEVVYLPLVQK